MKVALVVAAIAVATIAQDDNYIEIVGGHEATTGQHRYVAGLKRSATTRSLCGGSLIAPNVILTAAHCTDNGLSHAVVGSHFLTGSSDGVPVKITKEIPHPQYVAATHSNDVAILLLDRNVTTITPVTVSFEAVPANVLTWVRGWGTISSSGPQSQVPNP
ncbi:hypothetical protein AaE_008435, partial [Aphanomyces astaci]